MTTYPLTRGAAASVGLILLSVASTAWLSWAVPERAVVLWAAWAVTALFAFVIQDTLSRYYVGQIRNGVPFLVSWIVMSATSAFSVLSIEGETSPWLVLLTEACLLCVLRILLVTWEAKRAVLPYFSVGLIIGCLSTLLPSVLCWLLLLPMAFYQLRTFSSRNVWSVPTGVVWGIWVVYCLMYFLGPEGAADAMLCGYGRLWDLRLSPWPVWPWPVWTFLSFFLVLVLGYASVSLLFVFAKSIRGRANVMLVSLLALVELVFALLHLSDAGFHLGLLSVFLGLLIPCLLSYVRNVANEWMVLTLLILLMLAAVLPIALPQAMQQL